LPTSLFFLSVYFDLGDIFFLFALFFSDAFPDNELPEYEINQRVVMLLLLFFASAFLALV